MPLTPITENRNLCGMDDVTWAHRVQALRASGLRLREIAHAIGLAVSTVGDLANGRTGSPRGEAALKLDALYRARCGVIRGH